MKIKTVSIVALFFWGAALAIIAQAADMLGNISESSQEPEPSLSYSPGSWILLPDGTRTQIIREEPEGFRTDTGVLISPEGVIREGVNRGELVRPDVSMPPERGKGSRNKAQEKAPEQRQAQIPSHIKIGEPWPNETPETRVAVPGGQKKAQAPEELTLAQLLPVTELPGNKKPQEKPAAPEKQTPTAAPEKKAPAQKTPEKKTPAKQAQEKKAAPAKPRPGQELRIPPEAAKTGNLSFLEGCWQGTRPEYISKRTIRECFCFDANGRSGKRRVIDPAYNRMCIGASRATLSGNGVLSVVSAGAACNDGERWGQAEMVCKNRGPRTPCSWVFRDAHNGRQSYQIPFVRVESCGR